MKAEIPFEEICHVLKKFVAKKQEGHKKSLWGIPNPKDAAISVLVNNLNFKSLSSNKLEISLPVGKVTLSDIKVEENNISFTTSGSVDYLVKLAKATVEQYVCQEGNGKMSVLLSKLPKISPIFNWVNLDSISFLNDNIILNIVTVK